MPMNKKTFTVAVIFLIVTLVWLGVNIFWALSNKNCIFDLIVAVLFALAGAVWCITNATSASAGTSTR